MRVFIDTNILISAALWSNGTAAKAYFKAVSFPNKGVICDYNIEEIYRVCNKKFPARLPEMQAFIATALMSLELVPTPEEPELSEDMIRDVKDRPILRAAIAANADILLTGDNDFLESNVKHPRIMTAAEFTN